MAAEASARFFRKICKFSRVRSQEFTFSVIFNHFRSANIAAFHSGRKMKNQEQGA